MNTLISVDVDALQELRSRETFFWLDLDDPDPQTIDTLGEILSLHELAVEDSRDFGQRPKADAYGDRGGVGLLGPWRRRAARVVLRDRRLADPQRALSRAATVTGEGRKPARKCESAFTSDP